MEGAGDMTWNGKSRILEILKTYEAELVGDWIKEQKATSIRWNKLMAETELREQCVEFLSLLREALQNGNLIDILAPEWSSVREMLASISRSRSQQGFTPSETATFVFSLKKPLFDHLSQQLAQDGQILLEETWSATVLLDKLGLWTIEIYQKAQQELLFRQQEQLLELSRKGRSRFTIAYPFWWW